LNSQGTCEKAVVAMAANAAATIRVLERAFMAIPLDGDARQSGAVPSEGGLT
jgi:hypothetical protein